jgi:protein TonB
MPTRTDFLACLAALLAGCATPPAEKSPAPATPAARDLADLSLAAMRLQAQMDRQVEEYQTRPRKRFIGARASEYRFAAYEEKWRARVESVGAANFPPEARGRTANLRVTVSIRSDGAVESIEIDRSSGDKVLDSAVLNIVRQAAPFEPFPPEIARDTDLLVISRTWFFGPGGALTGRGEP